MADSAEIRVATEAVKEIQSLSSSERHALMSFLERLSENPYDGTVIGDAGALGDVFASTVAVKLYVYWSFVANGEGLRPNMPTKIKVLGLARKTANGAPRPVDRILKHA